MSTNLDILKKVFDVEFWQLATYEDGRTPLLLNEEQYNAAKSAIHELELITEERDALLSEHERLIKQEFSDDEYICIRDAVDRLICAVGKDVDGDQSECSLCAEFIDELINDVIKPLSVKWIEDDEHCGYLWGIDEWPLLRRFYQVNNYKDLVTELVRHIDLLQESAKNNVKPWEDTFPPTLLPAYIERINKQNESLLDGLEKNSQ